MALSVYIWKRKQFCHTYSRRRANMFVAILLFLILSSSAQTVLAASCFRPNNAVLSSKSLIGRSCLTIRGGSYTKNPSTIRRRVKTTNKAFPNNKKQEQPITNETESNSVSTFLSQQDLPIVETLLIPKSLGWTRLIRYASTVAVVISFLACIKTAGEPYAAAVYSTIHGTSTSQGVFQKSEEKITSLDTILARRLADAAGDVLPPPHLPTAGPLVSLLLSTATSVAATLFPKWFLHVHVNMNHNILSSREEELLQEQIRNGETVLALVKVPRDERHLNDDKSHVLCSLQVSESKDVSPKLYFDLHHKRFYYSPNDKQQQEQQQVYCGGPTLHTSVLIPNLICSPGLVTKSELRQAKERFGAYNKLTLSPPTIQAAFVSRISSPLSVLQLVGKFLSALEEDFKSSIFSLATTLIHHYWNARTSIVSATELSKEVGDSVTSASRECVWALRPNKKRTTSWKRIPAVELLPGDIFVMNSTSSTTMPVDALLLEGTCVMNEAILTGESISQTKWTLNAADEQDATFLDMTGAHRHSVLFAGTSLLYCTNTQVKRENRVPKLPKACSSGCRFLALRTGSYSSRGELLRALLARNSNHVGAISNPQTERDALRLIASLSCFAALACASLFYGHGNVKTSSFRRVIQCTRIAVASIPSDLPLALSSVAHSCSVRLRQEADVVCSEPGSLLTAAHVGTVVFDKTGTLTADTQALSLVVKPKGVTSAVVDMDEVILAGCHSLVDVNTTTNEQQIAGDPLDLASLQYTGWTYDRKYDAYQRKVPKGKDGPIKLWQLKTFPFDATRRTSSALILVLYADGKCRLWKTIKGSPDCISIIVKPTHKQWYNERIRKLGGKGLRTIAMAATDVTTDNDTFTRSLFPGGLPDITTASDEEFQEMIINAREKAGSLHRIDFEGFDNDWTAKSRPSFELVGFACFDAAVRPSTRRVIQELKSAQVNVIMLTGDGVDAAISVADTAGLLSNTDSIAILDIVSSLNGSSLVWRMIRKTNSKTKKLSSFKSLDTFNLTSDSVERMLCNSEKGDCSLVVTGKAAELLLSTIRTSNSHLYSRLRNNLDHFTIFARASPKQKKSIVSNLKEHHSGTKKVLMCGDGVNDVAAMKVADVGAALLNGYENESSNSSDLEDKRRLEQLSRRKIGSNRRRGFSQKATVDPIALSGIGDSATAASARITRQIDIALHEIQERAKDRQREGEYSVSYMLQDMKDSFSAMCRILNDERKRKRDLRKGGGSAARILAQDDKLRRQIIAKGSNVDKQSNDDQLSSMSSTIKPGEASLAAAFSLLRPAIDGVESLMRMGIAAAACASSLQQTIALNCLLACYNLATLYRDGFRYGKYLWNVELFVYMAINQAIYQSSTTPRPRLSRVRPNESLFHPVSTILVCIQAFMHLTTLTIGVRVANNLEAIYSVPKETMPKVRWKDDRSHSSTFASIAKALAASPRSPESNEKNRRGLNLLGRPPFRPNYATNVVFFMSIFQNGVSAIMTHTGKPFYGTILESRQLCLWIGASFLFVLACVTETMPQVNEFLELRLLPSRRYRSTILVILLIDAFGCFVSKWILDKFLMDKSESEIAAKCGSKSAADKEESLLAEEEQENKKILVAMAIVAVVIVVNSFF